MSANSLKILYVANSDSGTCKSRRKALQALGHRLDVVTFETCCGIWPDAAFRIYARLLHGPAVWRFNREIRRRALTGGFDWVWVDKGIFVYPQTVKTLVERNLFVIHHLTDDFLNPKHAVWYRHYKRALTYYHVHLTSNVYNVQELRSMGALHPIQTHLGFDPEFCWPNGLCPSPHPDHIADAAFVGFWRPHLDSFIEPLVRAGLKVRIWGTHWNTSKIRNLVDQGAGFRPATDSEYPYIYASAKIGLCFLNRENRNTSTGRSFEIPAIGAFMLAERTPEHEGFYCEGVEAEFFDTPEDFLEKFLYYVTRDKERKRIAEAGHHRAISSGYSYYDRIRGDLQNIMPIYEARLVSGHLLERVSKCS